MEFPLINISEESFQNGKQFEVIYSEHLNISVEKFKAEYKDQEVIDSKGDTFIIWGGQDAPQDLGNLMRGTELWPFQAKNSLKTTNVYKTGIVLSFKQLDKSVSLEALRNILISKIPEFHFSRTSADQKELLKGLNNCNSHSELMNLVYEE